MFLNDIYSVYSRIKKLICSFIHGKIVYWVLTDVVSTILSTEIQRLITFSCSQRADHLIGEKKK